LFKKILQYIQGETEQAGIIRTVFINFQ